MAVNRVTKKAPRLGAFFVVAARVAVLSISSQVGLLAAPTANVCVIDRADAQAQIEFVYDGDTVRTTAGLKIRLLGINTPELGHGKKPDQPLAQEARQLLIDMLARHRQVSLRFDQERLDRYQRTLAHLFLDDGTNAQEQLLRAGLATTLVLPPNQWSAACYTDVESDARILRQGVWALKPYQPVAAQDLAPSSNGYHVVHGSVQRIGQSKRNVWLNLTHDVALRFPRDDLAMFHEFDPASLLGKRVEVRGWIQRHKGQLRITVRHPAAIRLLP